MTPMGCVHNAKRNPETGNIDPPLIGGIIDQSPISLVNCNYTTIEDDIVEGEIIIAGDDIAQGYFKEELKTKDNFICWNGVCIYKTGDYSRWVRKLAGNRVIEFRGRKDRTINNRGFLVNLNRDVEDRLYHAGESLSVKSVRATATENGIIAVVTPRGVNTAALLTKAADIIAAIDQGKHAQEAMDATTSTSIKTHSTDRTEEKGKLAQVLCAAKEVFRCLGEKLPKIKADDLFIGMGGSSLLALKLVVFLR